MEWVNIDEAKSASAVSEPQPRASEFDARLGLSQRSRVAELSHRTPIRQSCDGPAPSRRLGVKTQLAIQKHLY